MQLHMTWSFIQDLTTLHIHASIDHTFKLFALVHPDQPPHHPDRTRPSTTHTTHHPADPPPPPSHLPRHSPTTSSRSAAATSANTLAPPAATPHATDSVSFTYTISSCTYLASSEPAPRSCRSLFSSPAAGSWCSSASSSRWNLTSRSSEAERRGGPPPAEAEGGGGGGGGRSGLDWERVGDSAAAAVRVCSRYSVWEEMFLAGGERDQSDARYTAAFTEGNTAAAGM